MQLFFRTIFDLVFVRLILLLLFLSSFNVLSNLADTFYYHTVSFATMLLAFSYMLLYLLEVLRTKSISQFALILTSVFILFAVPIFQAQRIFGQPIFYGFVGQISFLLCFSSLVMLEFLRKKLVDIKKVERFFVIVGCGTMLVFLYFFLFVDPSKYAGSDLVAINDLRGHRYRFSSTIIVMVYFYSLFKVLKDRKYYYIILYLATIAYFIFVFQSRTYIAVIGISTLIFILRNLSSRVVIKWSMAGIITIFVAGFFLSQLRPDVIDKYKTLYTNAIMVSFGENTDEYSTNGRLKEYDLAMKYFKKNPILGNGMVGRMWNDGWRGLFGWFYPADIGIFGNLFVFGILGTGIFYLLFIYGFRLTRKTKHRSVFYSSVTYTFLFLFLLSFPTSFNIKNASVIYFLLALIYYYRYYHVDVISKTQVLAESADESMQLGREGILD